MKFFKQRLKVPGVVVAGQRVVDQCRHGRMDLRMIAEPASRREQAQDPHHGCAAHQRVRHTQRRVEVGIRRTEYGAPFHREQRRVPYVDGESTAAARSDSATLVRA